MLSSDPDIQAALCAVEERYAKGAGFANRPGGMYRPDVTCWAVLALQAAGVSSDAIEKGRQSLVEVQSEDGRIPVCPGHPQACWPTALAVLAWHGAVLYNEPRERAIRFLLDFDEILIPETLETKEGHDVTIRGWPWVAGTHPWVEPTAYAALAMRACGHATHRRAQDAICLLLDRQLPSGGWNSGATITFGLEMRPAPESTGLALQALAGLVPKTAVEHSIAYLRSELTFLNSPISLAWATLGLHAWQETIDRPQERILQVLARQEKSGPHDTTSLSLLLLAWHCPAGLIPWFERTDLQGDQ